MENSIFPDDSGLRKVPLTAAQRKAKQRAKEKMIKEGTFEIPLIEQAKQELKNMDDMDLQKILDHPQFKEKLSETNKTQLKVFIQNHKSKLKMDQITNLKDDINKSGLQERALIFGNKQIHSLHASLLVPQTIEEKRELFKLKIEENSCLFMEYMENHVQKPLDFISIILELCYELEQETSTQLFIRICKLNIQEKLHIDKDMTFKAMEFLANEKQDTLAATGLLRLIYQNQISLHDFPLQMLQSFKSQYEQAIINCFSTILLAGQPLSFHIDPTCFVFTRPLLYQLNQGGDILHKQIPYQFLPYVLEIICCSFNEEESTFNRFLQVFKDGCKMLYDRLLSSKFESLLISLLEKTRSMEASFFKTLKQHQFILECAFRLLKEKRITAFTKDSVGILINIDEEKFQQMIQMPKILDENYTIQRDKVMKHLIEINPKMNRDFFQEEYQLKKADKAIFQAMGLHSLLPIQEICYLYLTQENLYGSYFIQFDTGQGKTSLCLAIAIKKASLKQKYFIVNNSKSLLFRDFKKALAINHDASQSIGLVTKENFHALEDFSIVYISYDNFIEYLSQNSSIFLKTSIVLIDEYDSIIFTGQKQLDSFNKLLQIPLLLIAFSGSKLMPFHKEFIVASLNSQFLDFSLNQSLRLSAQCKETEVYCLIPDYKKAILHRIKEQIEFSPVIIISGEQSAQIQKTLQSNGFNVENLVDQELQYIESALQVFNKKLKEQHLVYIISEEQGRGLDFQSTTDIERNGGIYLIIAHLPQSYLQYTQFIGRTARIGGKGQYSVILYDKSQRNGEGSIYLSKKLIELQNNDLLHISRIRVGQNNSNQNENCYNNSKDQDQRENVTQVDEGNEIGKTTETNNNQNCNMYQNIIFGKLANEFLSSNSEEEDSILYSDSSMSETNKQTLRKRSLKFAEKCQSNTRKRKTQEDIIRFDIDANYFKSYSGFEIHEEMIGDQVRMDAYKQAITQTVKDKLVVDVGAGTGVLSMFAAQSGASKVYAIENAEIVEKANEMVRQNGFGQQIIIIKGKAEDIELPVKNVDCIISEWMGYFLLYENMLPSVLNIRDRYLSKEGTIIPQNAQIYLAGICKNYNQSGLTLKMNEKGKHQAAKVEVVKQEEILTTDCEIFNINLLVDSVEENIFTSNFQIQAIKQGELNGLVGWFNAKLTDNINLSTSPFDPPTHWKQTQFLFKETYKIDQGDIIEGSFQMSPQKNNYRALNFKIKFKIGSMEKLKEIRFHLD